MTRKHHIPNSIKMFVQRHTDAENHEKLKKTHKDMEEKKNRLLSLMQSQQEIDVSKDESKRGTITELIEEFHKEYESLYTHYDALTEELKKKVQHKEKPKEKFSSSSESGSESDSDSDSDHSSKKKGLKNGELENGIRSATTLEVADLKSRLEVISNDKAALESDYMALSNKLHDSDRVIEDLKVEAERLNQEKSELLKENEQLKQELDTKVNEYKAGVEALKEQVDKLQAERSQLESEMDEEKREFSKRLSQMEDDNKELKTKVKTLTEDLSMRPGSKEDIVAKLERTIEGLRKEADKAMEKARTFEAQLRLANQKVRVTDQLLNEDDKTHKIALQKYEEKCRSLEERIAANNKAYSKMIINIPESMNKLLAGMESVAEKFESDHEKFTNKLTIISEEIHILKHCTSKKNTERDQKDVKKEMDEKISTLEVQKQKQTKEKEEMERTLRQLKTEMEELNVVLREKDEHISTLGEEKRQAIRQLCLWWDDAHSRYHHLKKVVSKAASETHLSR